MEFIKIIMLLMIFIASNLMGILFAKKYINRLNELKAIKTSLKIFQTKVKLTYEPIPKIFDDISKTMQENKNISKIFKTASQKMQSEDAGSAWIETLAEQQQNLSINKEDIDVLNGLSKLLGKVDIEGQITEIELVDTFLDTQIEKAQEEFKKNSKMYKTLGMTGGLAIIILLI